MKNCDQNIFKKLIFRHVTIIRNVEC